MSSNAVAIADSLRVRPDSPGVPVVNSRDVAKVFEKRHDHVLRDIDNLLGSPELGSLTHQWVTPFRLVVEMDEKANRELRSYDMTRDGFTLLAMGWTGDRAFAFKIAYIHAFNDMEAALKTAAPAVTGSDLIAAIREIVAPLAVRFDGQDRALERVESRVDAISEDVAFLKESLWRRRRNLNDKTKRDHILDVMKLGGRYLYALPRGATELRLVSPPARPTDSRPWAEDRRRLGVRIAGVTVDGVRLALDGPQAARGWWRSEPDGCRWTDGDASLALPPAASVLEVRLGG